jgi:uncharacterized protein (TIGR03083 family)
MTSTSFPVLDTAEHLAQLRAEGGRLAAAAAALSLDVAVPPCPGWSLRDLLRHLGYVHRWATRYVTERHTERVSRLDETAVLAQDIPDDALLDWFRAGHTALVSALTAADPELACWSFLPAPSPLAFWARRQAHETTVHRVDVQLAAAAAKDGRPDAANPVTPVPAALATDGVDELLMGFARRGARHGPRSDPPRALFIEAGPARWVIRMGPERAEVNRGWDGPAGPGDCTLTGPAPELYLLLWNRRDPAGLDVTGDPGVLAQFRREMRVTWA